MRHPRTAACFLRRASPNRPLTIHESTQTELLSRRWPGNVRELRAVTPDAPRPDRGVYDEFLHEFENAFIDAALT
jgi:hypothetical protein